MNLKVHNALRSIERHNPVLLVTGDGRSLLQDKEKFFSWGLPHDVMCIGRSINIQEGRVLHWANVDGPTSEWWAEHLPLKNNGDFPLRHTLGEVRGYDVDWDIEDEYDIPSESVLWHGSTSLFTAMIGIAMGYEKIVLAGCPMDSNGHWYLDAEHRGPRWTGECFIAWLEFAREKDASRVRSLSGYTAQMIGEATKSWVEV